MEHSADGLNLWVLFGFLMKPCLCFMKPSLAVHSFVLFCRQTEALSSYNIIPQAQAKTAPGNQCEPLKMKVANLNEDSMTLENLGTLAEGLGIGLLLTPRLPSMAPDPERKLQVVDKDGSP